MVSNADSDHILLKTRKLTEQSCHLADISEIKILEHQVKEQAEKLSSIRNVSHNRKNRRYGWT